MTDSLRIGNCSGFYGDRFSAASEMVSGGHIDVLTGDYLAELTMFILAKARAAGRPAYATTFLRQMSDVLVPCLERGIKIVTNAGGLDPKGLAQELGSLAAEAGLSPSIAYLTGDDLMPQMAELRSEGEQFRNIDTGELLAEQNPFTANAYLGGRGIARALHEGADIVVCPRVTDASLVVGPCMWKFDWDETDFDELAGAVAAGHVIECGTQATGGNYAFFEEITAPGLPGFPIAEMHHDGSSVITKHDGTGGAVTVDTVTAQLLYEVGDTAYLNADVTAHLDTVELTQVGVDRVLLSGTQGGPPPPTLKVSMTLLGPYRQSVVFGIPGDNVEAKAARLERDLEEQIGGFDQFDDVSIRLVRTDQPGATVNELAFAQLSVSFAARDKALLGRRIFDSATAMALSSFPGIFFPGERQQRPTQTGVNWPCLIDAEGVRETIVIDGNSIAMPSRKPVPSPPDASNGKRNENAPAEVINGTATKSTEMTRVSLGEAFGARSGDKGAHANVGIWGRSDDAYTWLHDQLTPDALRALLPEADSLVIRRSEFPNLRGINFVIEGILGAGAAAGARFDAQAKGLAEFVRSRSVQLPTTLLSEKATKETLLR